MLETRSTEIDGKRYEVTQLPARQGFRLLARVGATVGPALGMLAEAKSDPGAFARAIAKLFENLTPDDLDLFVDKLLIAGRVTCDGAPLERTFDLEMAGKGLTVAKLLLHAFEVNFGDFSDAVRGLMPAPAAAPASPASST